MFRHLLISAAIGLTAVAGMAQDLRVPASVTAGEEATISTSGSGKATFYLLGPGVSSKSDVSLGDEIRIGGKSCETPEIIWHWCALTVATAERFMWPPRSRLS